MKDLKGQSPPKYLMESFVRHVETLSSCKLTDVPIKAQNAQRLAKKELKRIKKYYNGNNKRN